MRVKFGSKDWKGHVPQPVDETDPGYVDFYYFAWQKAFEHIRSIPGMPQDPYMDEAFCDTVIWIWDTCFMSLYCKYAPDIFPGVQSFRNFYHVLYDHGSLGLVQTRSDEPAWTRSVPGKINRVRVHNSDNPPLFAWAEYENALFTGDTAHLKELLVEKQYLQKHFCYLEDLDRKDCTLPNVLKTTNLVHHAEGYFWEGGASGMDNSPRGRINPPPTEKPRPNNPEMYWVDIISQQALAARSISRIASLIGENSMAGEWQQKWEEKKKLIRELYWDPADHFFYDIHCKTHEPMRVKTLASVWPYTAEAASPKQASWFLEKLRDPQEFGGFVPWVSLARNDGDFNGENGCYWRGSVWLPTAYAGMKGLMNYGFFRDVSQSAKTLLHHIYRTWQDFEPHTIWEAYSPNNYAPARSCDENSRIVRPDFCGWSALGPISIYIEFVLGFHTVDAFRREVSWELDPKRKGKTGIRNLRFGDITTDIVADDGMIQVCSDKAYTLIVNGNRFEVAKGEQTIFLDGNNRHSNPADMPTRGKE